MPARSLVCLQVREEEFEGDFHLPEEEYSSIANQPLRNISFPSEFLLAEATCISCGKYDR